MVNTAIAISIIALLLILLKLRVFRRAKTGLIVLKYTAVGTPFKNSKQKKRWTSQKTFIKQLNYLSKKGYSFISAQDLLKKELSPKSILLTFDHGFENFYTKVFPILKDRNIPSLVFLTVSFLDACDYWHQGGEGPWQNMLSSRQIKELKKSGLVDFGSRGLTNIPLTDADSETIDNEIKDSAARMNNLLKIKPLFFAYPFCKGFIQDNIEEPVKQTYKLAFADTNKVNPLPLDRQKAINRISVSGKICKIDFINRIKGKESFYV